MKENGNKIKTKNMYKKQKKEKTRHINIFLIIISDLRDPRERREEGRREEFERDPTAKP